ncbi:MAG: folylpolyglutamate synthase/dihydrofolate synthase family protein [Pseudomonadota bacterium]
MGDRALADWLVRLEHRSPESRIELGLDRVSAVLERLELSNRPRAVATVGGTNGKGSVVAYLEAMARASGYRTYAYTSPHLIDFSERFRIDGKPAPEAEIAEALSRVEAVRGDLFLTYFEHTTLAGWVLADRANVDFWVLEVGLGGRLDAVNAIDPDVSIITSIGLDHTDWLGPTRLHVAREKAGIARKGQPLVIGERRPPKGLDAVLDGTEASLWRIGREFRSRRTVRGWTLRWADQRLDLPDPGMSGDWQYANAACAVLALWLLCHQLPVDAAAMVEGLQTARVLGRFQRVHERPEVILDVAHNPAAARALSRWLATEPLKPTVAVYSALSDKDIAGVGRALKADFQHWILAPLDSDRARSVSEIEALLRHAAVTGRVNGVESIALAVEEAMDLAGADGRVVVFGSFLTVAEAWPLFDSQ